jgi:uncharacterized phiE125 gp8 family phage protein
VQTTDLKGFVNISDSADDAYLALAIEAASRAVDRHTNRQFGSVSPAQQRFYTARWDRRRCRWVVDIDDLMTVTNLDPRVQDVDGNDLGAIDDYTLEPRNAAQTGRPWTQLVVRPTSTHTPTGGVDEVAITALWGWTAVPDTVEQATLLQASRIFSRRKSPFGIAGSPDLGSELRLLAKVDADVAVALGPYIRWWGSA